MSKEAMKDIASKAITAAVVAGLSVLVQQLTQTLVTSEEIVKN